MCVYAFRNENFPDMYVITGALRACEIQCKGGALHAKGFTREIETGIIKTIPRFSATVPSEHYWRIIEGGGKSHNIVCQLDKFSVEWIIPDRDLLLKIGKNHGGWRLTECGG